MIGATAPEKAGHVQNPPSLRYEVTPCISMGDFSCAVSPYIYSLWQHSMTIITVSNGFTDPHQTDNTTYISNHAKKMCGRRLKSEGSILEKIGYD